MQKPAHLYIIQQSCECRDLRAGLAGFEPLMRQAKVRLKTAQAGNALQAQPQALDNLRLLDQLGTLAIAVFRVAALVATKDNAPCTSQLYLVLHMKPNT